MTLLIKNVKLLNHQELTDVIIEYGKIKAYGMNFTSYHAEVIDAKGQYLLPGFVDIHVHLREPGGEAKETIDTGTLAAAKGGFTTVCAMPNTNPVPDSSVSINLVNDRIEQSAHVRVLPYAAITKDQGGEELVDFVRLKGLGAFGFTDDGVGVQSAGMMYEAMKQAKGANASIVAHCEDNSLVYEGVMHDGKKNEELGLPGIPSISESLQIARDVLLAEATGCHNHVCHVSTKESVRVIRDAKRAGIPVTAEVTPHHLLLTENDIPSDDAHYKMNPPLRAYEDRQALIDGLLDGTIDCIATDHAPHTVQEKSHGFQHSPFGIVGLETAFPLLYSHFVQTGIFTLNQLVLWLTKKPCDIFGLPYGTMNVGDPADLVLVDLEETQTIDSSNFSSKGHNTPFNGWDVNGVPTLTIVNGKIAWRKEKAYV
ncbi:dihydroorotase [Tenuibacillus multivorans]|uniref:Dihydroorotase n=1 Tax=Tenuibacillus multivorans TaxID=237069 RepID=A0A1G9Y4C2_9BACI|nr:dihydroorotase [Tenuibacillus multivorans]GEL75945.1 dihydroorotase [Tenuibacillus multivorans]SDN03929.1 dihydroorotase [Tenuibacillus multivorans]